MRIVLDLQACQSPGSRRRGIGRYSLALAKAMAQDARGHEIIVLLNAVMDDSIEFLRGQFDGLIPQERIITWEAIGPLAQCDSSNAFRRHASEALRAESIRRLRPDVVHVSSLFEGFTNEVVATVPATEDWLHAVTLYDLIPLTNKSAYLPTPETQCWYKEKLEHLKRADMLLGISRYSCEEAKDLLHVPDGRLTDISGAADDIFARLDDPETFRQELMSRYRLRRSFVMYAGGFDTRKNLGALIRAFASLPLSVRCVHQLVIVGDPPPVERQQLAQLVNEFDLAVDDVVFAGYVPDDDLVKLYNLCALYVFPSLQEGFGLPALEAMSSGAVVIGSNTSSLPEVIGCADALFDPRHHQAIAAKMAEALTSEDLRTRLRTHAEEQCRKFSWQGSARRALDAFESVVERRRDTGRVAVPTGLLSEATEPFLATAFLPAPEPKFGYSMQGEFTVYADVDCRGIDDSQPLSAFDRARDADAFGRVVIELADDAYCAKTLKLAVEGAVDIVLRDRTFGKALETLAQTDDGRALVLSLLYASGGYSAPREAIDHGFTEGVLGRLVSIESLLMLGRSQVIASLADAGERQPSLAWREASRRAVAELAEAEQSVPSVATPSGGDWQRVAGALAANVRIGDTGSQWLVDISNLAAHDAGTGIQRVVRNVLDELIATPPPGVRVEPVRIDNAGVLRYARTYCAHRYFPGIVLPPDEPVEYLHGDVYLGLDLSAHLIPQNIGMFHRMRDRGVRQYYVVYDLLPLLRPDCFDPQGLPLFRAWYEAIAGIADGAICISQAVASEFESWLHQYRPERQRPLHIGWFHLGADLVPTIGTDGSNGQVGDVIARLGDRPTFLMVGTVEPRKGHAQTLAGFERLWKEGVEANLVVIGKPGWLVDDLLRTMADHPERGRRFFWFEQASDELLLAAYKRASALVMASEGEGFGLPLIEAAHHGVPLIVRDLPVFREIAGEHAFYFSGYQDSDLWTAVRKWLALDVSGDAPQSAGIAWNTWKEASLQLSSVIRDGNWTHDWMPTPQRRYAAFDHRFTTEVGQLVRCRMVCSGQPGVLIRGPFVPLEAGHYVVHVYGGGMLTGTVDIRSADGTSIHSTGNMGDTDTPESSTSVQLNFVLSTDVRDIEIQVRANTGDDGWISEIELHPVAPPRTIHT